MTKMKSELKVLLVVPALAVSVSAGAIPNPQIAKDATPVVLECAISNVVADEGDTVSKYAATCEVIEVIRSNTEVEQWDLVQIAWEVVHSRFDNENHPPTPGPAFPTPPPKLVDGQTVLAYLKAVPNTDKRLYVPNIGMDSFEVLEEPAAPRSGKCKDAGDAGPIMANAKVCAEETLTESRADLDALFADLLDRMTASAASYQQSTDQAMAQQAEGQRNALRNSQAAWIQYRDETCRLAYYEFYPGSMARLVELDCLKALTDQRAAQLRSITAGSAKDPIRF